MRMLHFMLPQSRSLVEPLRPTRASASRFVFLGVALGALVAIGSTASAHEIWSHAALMAGATVGIAVASRLGVRLDARLQREGRRPGLIVVEVYLLAWIVGKLVYAAGAIPFRSPTGDFADEHPGLIATSGLPFLVLFALLNVIGHYVERVDEQDVALAEQLGALDASRRLMVRTSDELHREFAERLHGGVQARLLCAEAGLRRIDGSALPPHVADQVLEVADALASLREAEVRELSHQLHPLVIRVGLVAALEQLAAQLAQPGVLEIDVVVTPQLRFLDGVDNGGLAEPARLALYRATEEAIGNALRHGGARHVAVVASVPRPGEVRVEVRDDGRGCAGFTPGFGLAHATLRLEAHGGSCTLRERAGGGSTFEASVRVRAEDIGVAAPTRPPVFGERRMPKPAPSPAFAASGQGAMTVPSMNRSVAATRG